MVRALVDYYNKDGVRVSLEDFNFGGTTSKTEVLHSYADTYNYVLLDGRRLTPTTRSRRKTAGSSLVQVIFDGEPFAGELDTIFRHKQVGIPDSEQALLAFIRWMVPSGRTPLDDDKFIWYENDFKELGVESWEYNQYASHGDEGYPPVVMRVEDIQCQIARGTLTHTDPKLWMTISLDRVRSLHLLQILTESLSSSLLR
ncbi:hypothetical protein B0H13DRAFT_1675487 [Mycena leptocephala]|nr:hypothetical protein B0H13DRAFT_1675487 [Mycena leptocephala]